MSTNSASSPGQGEVWLVDFDPAKGSEMRNRHPAVVVNDDSVGKLPLRVIVPVTVWKARYAQYPWFTRLVHSQSNGLVKSSGADGFQVKSISCDRFLKKLGKVKAAELQDIHYTIVFCLGLDSVTD